MLAERVRTHGGSTTPMFRIWAGIRTRCNNKNNKYFHRYGGRGIRVCEAWAGSYPAFREWAVSQGWRQGLEVDRIDNDGDYSPENCRIVTHKENCRNRPPPTWLRHYRGGKLCA